MNQVGQMIASKKTYKFLSCLIRKPKVQGGRWMKKGVSLKNEMTVLKTIPAKQLVFSCKQKL